MRRSPRRRCRLVDSVLASTSGLPAELGTDIAATSALLRAEANFELGRDGAAADTLSKLRTDFPTSDSAVYSYIVEADRYAQQDKVIDAERLLTKLADDFPASPYAPYALYQAALQAERLGTDANLKEAYKLLENLVTNPRYAQSELIFPARMRQGDLLRELNQFPQAQQVYELLVNNPGRPRRTTRSSRSWRWPSATTPSRRTAPPTPTAPSASSRTWSTAWTRTTT
jgi:tetratricopeptide (TPR) repeat protein